MTNSLRTMSLAFVLTVSTTPFITAEAKEKSTFMADCSAKFKAAKAADTLGKDTKWTDFMKNQCAADAAAVEPAPEEPMAKPVKVKKTKAKAAEAPAEPAPEEPMAKPAKVKKAKAAEAPAEPVVANTTKTPSGSFMQNCSTEWKAMKAAGTVPEGMAWKDFVAAKCVVTPVAAMAPAKPKKVKKAAEVAEEATPEVMAKPKKVKKAAVMVEDETPDEPAAKVDATPVKLVDKNGKAFTPGQLAAHQRARACGARWRGEKEAGTLEAGVKWPQYWSACNTQLKAEAQ